MADFKKLDVFHGGHALALNVIRASATMRGPIALAIKGQMVRAALSVESLFGQPVTVRKKLVNFLHRLKASIDASASKAGSKV